MEKQLPGIHRLFVRFGFHIYPGRLFKAVCAGCGTSGDTIFFRVYRKAADAADTLAIVARLHGVDLFITTNAENDA